MATEILRIVLVDVGENVVNAKRSNEPLVGISPQLNFVDNVSIPGTVVAYAGDEHCTRSWNVEYCLG